MNLILVVILGLVSSKIDFLCGQFSLRIALTPGPRYEPLTSDLVNPLKIHNRRNGGSRKSESFSFPKNSFHSRQDVFFFLFQSGN